MKYKKQDRIITKDFSEGSNLYNKRGTILDINKETKEILIEFDIYMGGHTGGGLGQDGHCYWLTSRYLKLDDGKPFTIKDKIENMCEYLYT